MKLPDALRRLIAPLHTPAGIFGAILIAIQLVRGGLDLASTVQFAELVWPTLWGYITSPLGTFLSVVIGLGLYVWGGRQATKAHQPEIPNSDLPQETLDAIVADVSRRIESVRLSIQGSLESVWTEINAQRAAIVQIERRTTFPPNLGDTLGEALISSENVRLSQIARIRDEVHTYDERLKWLGPDILRLLHFATLQATATAIEGLIAEAPKAIAPLDISEETTAKLLTFVSRCEVVLMACGRYQAFRSIMQNSEIAVDGRLDNIPTPQYPPDVTPANYRKRIILQEQFKNLMDYQNRELRGLNEGIVSSRSDLIDRSNRTNS